MIRRKKNVYRLDTPSTTLLIFAEVGKDAEYLYYGPRLNAVVPDYEFLRGTGEGDEACLRLVSSFGGFDQRRNMVACVLADGGFSARFFFRGAKTVEKPDLSPLPSSYAEGSEKNASKTLCLEFSDEPSKLRLYLYYTVFEDSDVISVSSRLHNGGKKEIAVKNLASLQLDLHGNDYEFVSFHGGLADEMNQFSQPVNGGIVCNESYVGSSSHRSNPFVMLRNGGGVYAFNLVYSGNHKETAEADFTRRTRVIVGINDFMLDKKLAAGKDFYAPEAVMTYAKDEDGISRAMHAFVRKHIVRGKWRDKERPVLFNSWEGAYFSFDGARILEMAKSAVSLGAELFVIDDGWFGKRDDDTSSLGDWFDYEEKTGGLPALAEKIRETGMKFGIWIEPEMISEDSELYRKHPEFAMKIPAREPVRMRSQLLLNMADERVQKYLVRVISALLTDTKAAYVKWDYNRRFTDCYGKNVPSGEYFLKYTEGFYTVLRKLTERFPNVLFESCASGGGRFDLGVMCFTPQVWTSDNTDARCRLRIQSGVSYGYPQSVASAHVSASPNHQTGNVSPLSTRFNIAAFGAFGYENDPAKYDEAEREAVKKQIAFYKKNRKLFQFGTLYRLGDAEKDNVCGFIAVSENAASAVATVAVREKKFGNNNLRAYFKGLDERTVYEVKRWDADENKAFAPFAASGELLMNGGLPLEGASWNIFEDRSAEAHGNSVYTALLLFEKVKRQRGT